VTEDLREEVLTTLHGLGKSLEEHGDERSRATAGCLYCLCLAICEGVEVDLMRHMLSPNGDDDDFADAVFKAGNLSGH
jgi:hypothetical protein